MPIARASIPKEGLLPPNLAPFYLRAGLWIGIPVALLALFSFYELTGYGNPPWAPWLSAALLLASIPLLTYLMVGFAVTNVGIALRDDGVVFYSAILSPRRAMRRLVPWSELKTPLLGGSTIAFETSREPVSFTFEQARAILTDPRYPWRSDVPAEVLRKLAPRPKG